MNTLIRIFFTPWVAMVSWGMFLYITNFHETYNWPFLGYWAFFAANLVLGMIGSPTYPIVAAINKLRERFD